MLKDNIKDLIKLSAKAINNNFPEEQKRYIALVVLEMYKSGELEELYKSLCNTYLIGKGHNSNA
jgi:hypothetical protein